MKFIFLIALSLSITTAFGQKDSTKNKEYLAVLSLTQQYQEEKNWTPDVQKVVGQHFQRLLKFQKEGIVVVGGPTGYEVNNPDQIGIVIFYAKDDNAAQEFMREDPAVKGKIMNVKVHPFILALKCL